MTSEQKGYMMTRTEKYASELQAGDVMVLGTSRREWEVKGTSRAMPASDRRIAILGPRVNGRTLVWYFDLDETVEVKP